MLPTQGASRAEAPLEANEWRGCKTRGVKAVKRSESVQGNGREGSFGSVGPLLVVCSFDAAGSGLLARCGRPANLSELRLRAGSRLLGDV